MTDRNWLAVGLATGPADRVEAEDAVRTAYRLLSPGTVETPFYDEPVGGDQLVPEDVARAAMYALGQPPHVDVNEILLRPTVQAF